MRSLESVSVTPSGSRSIVARRSRWGWPLLGLAMAVCVCPTARAANVTWSGTTASTAWLTTTNWSTGAVPTSSDVAIFQNAGTATTAGLNYTTLSGTYTIQAIVVDSTRTRGLTIGNSAATSGTLTLTGNTINSTNNVILRNASGSLFTIQDNETGTGKVMNLALGNATENVILVDGSGGITISSTITGAGRNLTLGGTGSGVLTLSASNTYSGTTRINAGTLSISSDSNLGTAPGAATAGSLVIAGGTLSASTGFTLNSNRGITLGPASSSGTGTINVAAGTLSYGGIIANNTSGTGALVKTGAGTLSLSGANSYSGNTIVAGGTLAFGASRALGGFLVLGGSAAATTVGSFDLSAASGTFGGLTVQTFTSATNRITIGSGQTLATNGNVTIGTSASGTGATNLVVTGTSAGVGTWSIANSQATGFFQVGQTSGSTQVNPFNVDLSGLGVFTANLSGTNSVFRIGANNNASTSAASGTMTLAVSSTITANRIGVGDASGQTNTYALLLGSGSQRLNTNTLVIGNGSSTNSGRSSGVVRFAGAAGSLVLRGTSGDASRSDVTMISGSVSTGVNVASVFDVRGRDADLLLGTVAMTTLTGGTVLSTSSTLSFDQGTLDATTFTIGSRSGSFAGAAPASATVNIGTSTNTAVNTATIGTIAMASHASTTGTITGALNVAGPNSAVTVTGSWVVASNSAASGGGTSIGTVTISSGSVNANSGIVLRSGGGFGTVSGSLAITGGVLTSGSTITSIGTFGGGSAALTLNGGRLDMGGYAIGGSGQTVNASFLSGTLSNLGELNAGSPLTKSGAGTLALTGTNTYSGGTELLSGTLSTAAISGIGSDYLAVKNGATFAYTGSGTETTTRQLWLDTGSSTINVSNAAGSLTWNPSGGTRNQPFTKAGPGSLTMGGDFTGGASVTVAAGLLTLSASNTYTGDTLVTGGTLAIGNALALQNSPLDTSGGGTTVLGGGVTTLTLGGLKGSGDLATEIASGYPSLTALTLNVASGVSGTYSGVIADGAAGMTVTKTGSGTQVLTGSSSYTGITTISGGTLALSGAGDVSSSAGMSLSSSGAALDMSAASAGRTVNELSGEAGSSILLGANTLTASSTSSGTFGGVIGGSGGLTKTGAGTLSLSGANTFTGDTLVSAGTIAIGNALALQNSPLDTSGAGRLTLDAGVTTLTLGGLRGSTDLATEIASGYSSLTALTLNVASGVSGTYSGVIANGAAGMSLTKTGAGTQVITTAAQTYTGTTTVQSGTLAFSSSGSINLNSEVVVAAGATLTTSVNNTFGNSSSQAPWTVAGTILGTGNAQTIPSVVTLNSGTLGGNSGNAFGTFLANQGNKTIISNGTSAISATSFGLATTATFSTPLVTDTLNVSAILGGGTSVAQPGGIVKTGLGTLSLSGSSRYTGSTRLDSGTLAFVANSLGTGTVTLNGGVLQWASGNTQDLSSRLALVSGSTATLDTGANNVAFASGFGGSTSASLVKLGASTLTLSASNAYSGTTTISAGAILAGNNSAIGTSTLVVGSGAQFRLDSGVTINRPATIAGAGYGNTSGAIFSNATGGATATYSGNVTLAADGTRIGAQGQTGGSTLIVSGTIDSGADPYGLVIRNAGGDLGFVQLSAPNTYLGSTWIAIGTLRLAGGNNRLPTTTNLRLGYTASGTWNAVLELNGRNQEVAGLALDPATTVAGSNNIISNTSATLSTFTVNTGTAASTFNGVLTGNLKLVKNGTNSLTFTGTGANYGTGSSYTGGVDINAGTLVAASANVLGTGALTINSGTLDLRSSVTTGAVIGASSALITGGTTGNLVLTSTSTVSGTYAGIISNGAATSVGLNKNGTGTLTLTGSSTFTGGITAVNGNVVFTSIADSGSASPLGASGALRTNGGIFVYSGTGDSSNRLFTFGPSTASTSSLNNRLFANGSGALNLTNTGSNDWGGNNGARTLVLGGTSTALNTFAPRITDNGSGTASFTKQDAGTWLLSGSNSFTGGTTITGGTLLVGNTNALGATSGALAVNGGTLDLNGRSITVGLLSGSSGASITTSAAAGTTTLTSIYTGGTSTYGGSITDNGSGLMALVATGTGRLNLSGSSAYSGGTQIAGISQVAITNSAALGTGTVTLSSTSSSLAYNLILNTGSLTVANPIVISATAGRQAIQFNNSGTASLTGPITLSGSTTSNQHVIESRGTLTVSGGITGPTGYVSLRGVNGGTLTLTGTVNLGGSSTVDVNGGGVVRVNSTNNVWATTLLNSGTLILGASDALPTGSRVTVNTTATTSVLDLAGFNQSVAGLSYASAATGSITILNNGAGVSTLTLAGLGQNNTYLGALADGTGGGTLALVMNSSGRVQTLSGSSSYSGGTTITSGTLQVGNANALGAASNSLSVNGGALDLNGNSLSVGLLTGASGGTITTTTGNATLTTDSASSGAYGGVISGAVGLVKQGGGTLTLTSANTYTGATQVNAGILALGVADALSNSTAVAVAGGGLDMGAFSDMVASVSITSGSIIGSGTLTAATYGLGGGTVAGNLGAGTLTVTANSGLDGTSAASVVNLNAGTLTLGSSGRLTSSIVAVSGSSGAAITLGGNESFGSLAGAANVGLGSSTLTVGGAGSSTSYAGVINGSGGLTKTGVGTMTLTGAQEYTGVTAVGQGVLALGTGASIATSSVVRVAGGAVLDAGDVGGLLVSSSQTLAGSGTVAGGLTIANGATLSPGNSPGTLFTTGTVTWGGAGNYNWQIYTTAGGAGTGTGWDLLSGSGLLDITASGGSPFKINMWSLSGIGPDVSGAVSDFDSTTDYKFLIAEFAGGITGFDPTKFSLHVGPINGTGGFQNSYEGEFSVVRGDTVAGGNANQIYIVYAAVPEPGTFALAAVGLAAAAWAVRRRRRRPHASA